MEQTCPVQTPVCDNDNERIHSVTLYTIVHTNRKWNNQIFLNSLMNKCKYCHRMKTLNMLGWSDPDWAVAHSWWVTDTFQQWDMILLLWRSVTGVLYHFLQFIKPPLLLFCFSPHISSAFVKLKLTRLGPIWTGLERQGVGLAFPLKNTDTDVKGKVDLFGCDL